MMAEKTNKQGNFTKKDLVETVHLATHVSQRDARDVVQCVLDSIVQALLVGKNVELRNFGIFELQKRKQRVGRNPNQPQLDVVIPERVVVKFKVGKELKEKISKINTKKL